MSKNQLTTFDLIHEAKKLGKHPISYSQLSIFHNCPWAWKLRYIDKVSKDAGNIYTLFGSAIHTAIQTYLEKYYSSTIKSADELDLNSILLLEMKNEFETMQKQLGTKDFTSKQEMIQFYNEGCQILDYFKKNKAEYFKKRDEKLVDIEHPILVETDSNQNVMLLGFLDIVISNPKTNRLRIIDIKTSTKGWYKEKKSDFLTSAQLILYKKYYAKRYKIDPNNIDIEFLIVKRQLLENCEFPQKRIQVHKPASGTTNMNKAEKLLEKFTGIFDFNGKLKSDVFFPKVGGNACRWCEFNEPTCSHCPKSERLS